MNTNTTIHPSSKIYGSSDVGEDSIILENTILGYPEHGILMEILDNNQQIEDADFPGCIIGPESIVRPGTTIFSNVTAGCKFKTVHNVVIRENTTIGDNAFFWIWQ